MTLPLNPHEWATHVEATPATDIDLSYIMATERLDGNDRLVGRWSEEQHRAAMADNRHAYVIARLNAEPIGFAIVRVGNSELHTRRRLRPVRRNVR